MRCRLHKSRGQCRFCCIISRRWGGGETRNSSETLIYFRLYAFNYNLRLKNVFLVLGGELLKVLSLIKIFRCFEHLVMINGGNYRGAVYRRLSQARNIVWIRKVAFVRFIGVILTNKPISGGSKICLIPLDHRLARKRTKVSQDWEGNKVKDLTQDYVK